MPARRARILAFWVFVLVLAANAPFVWTEIIPAFRRPQMGHLVFEVPLLAAVATWAIAAAWAGFRRRSRAALVAGVVLLALYSVVLVLFASFHSPTIRVTPETALYLGTLWVMAGLGTWGAIRDTASRPSDLLVRGWSPGGALAALFLSLVAAAQASLLDLVPRAGGWLTAEIAAGFAAYAALAILVALLAWAGLAFRRPAARIGLLPALLAYSVALGLVMPWPDPRYERQAEPWWPVLVFLGALWAAACLGALASRARG